jgi:hypothetical protein
MAALPPTNLPKGISQKVAETLKTAYALSLGGFFRCGEVTYDD